MSLEYSKPKDKDPVVVLALALDFVVSLLKIQEAKTKPPAVVFIGGVSPECDN